MSSVPTDIRSTKYREYYLLVENDPDHKDAWLEIDHEHVFKLEWME